MIFGIIFMALEEDQNVQVNFMMKSTQNQFNWPRKMMNAGNLSTMFYA